MDNTTTRIMLEENVLCKNCNVEIDYCAKYCHTCGQKVMSERLNTKTVLNDFITSLTNIENGFWYSLKCLMLRPGVYLADYLNGGTKKYSNVFRLIFYLTALSFFVNQYSGFMDAQIKLTTTPGDSETTVEIINLIQNYMMYLFFLMIPFFALASYFLFRKWKLYFAEHLVLNAIWLSGTTLLGFVNYLLIPIIGTDQMHIYGAATMIIFIGYFAYATKSYFNISWLKSIFFSALHIFLGYILFTAVMATLGFVIAGVYEAIVH